MNKLGRLIISILFIALGLFLIGYGYVIYKNDYIQPENRVYVTGEILEVKGFESTWDSTHRLAVVRYEVDGEEMTSEIDYRSIIFAQDYLVDIYYDKDHPEMISSNTSNWMMIVFPILGFASLIFGIVLMLKKKKKRRMKRA